MKSKSLQVHMKESLVYGLGVTLMWGCPVPQVAWRRPHQDRLPHLRQHHPLLQPAGGAVSAADAGGVRHRRYVSSPHHNPRKEPFVSGLNSFVVKGFRGFGGFYVVFFLLFF